MTRTINSTLGMTHRSRARISELQESRAESRFTELRDHDEGSCAVCRQSRMLEPMRGQQAVCTTGNRSLVQGR